MIASARWDRIYDDYDCHSLYYNFVKQQCQFSTNRYLVSNCGLSFDCHIFLFVNGKSPFIAIRMDEGAIIWCVTVCWYRKKKMQFRKFRNIFHTVSIIYFTFVCIVSFLCCHLKKRFVRLNRNTLLGRHSQKISIFSPSCLINAG